MAAFRPKKNEHSGPNPQQVRTALPQSHFHPRFFMNHQYSILRSHDAQEVRHLPESSGLEPFAGEWSDPVG